MQSTLNILFTAFSCFWTFFLQAQYDKHRFAHLDISRGLSHNEVTCTFKDEKGFLWLGTMSGLNRYDGYSFKIFRHDLHDSSSINDNFIVQILEGPDHQLWINTRQGFTIYDPLTEKFDPHAKKRLHALSIDSDTLTDLRKATHKDGRVDYWFLMTGRGAGLYRYDPSTHSTRCYCAGHLQSFAADTAGGWWLLHSNGLLERMDAATGRITWQTDCIRQHFLQAFPDCRLYVDAQNDCWFYGMGKQSGVFYFHPADQRFHLIQKNNPGNKGLNTNLVTGIVQDDQGQMWIATDHGGVDLLDKKDFSVSFLLAREDDDKSLSQNSINCLYKDYTGVIWVGTYKKGVSYYHSDIQKFPLYRHQPSDPNSLPYDDVNRFVEDVKGNLFIGTNGGGLLYYNRLAGKYTRYQHDPANSSSLSNDVIVSLCLDHEQHLWIGTYYGGLDCWDGKTFKHFRHKDADSATLADDRVWEVHEDKKGRLWVGTLAAGLDLFDRKKQVFIHYRPDPTAKPDAAGTYSTTHSGYISELMEDRTGALWVGTAIGLDVLDPVSGRFRHYVNTQADPSSLSNDNVISIMEDSRGFVWIGTRDGLCRFDTGNKTFTVYRTAEGLPDNTILTILEDNEHNLWLGTPNGLCNILVSKHDHTYTFRCRNYDESNGLQGREFNENAALRTQAGELIFGGAGGFNLFDPRRLHNGSQHAPIVLTDFQVFNKSLGIGESLNGHVILPQSITESRQITLRDNENVFSIGFAALDFLNAQKIKYLYKLEGFNKDWLLSDDKTRKAVYTNLDPGDYVFKVRVAPEEDAGSDSGPILEMGIRILPPFWKTPLAYLLYVLLLVGALLFARHMILQRAHMRFALQQERKEAQRLHELDMMKIRFFTNVSHEFRTPLSLILTPLDKIIRSTDDPAQKNQFNLIHRNARRLLNMVNQLLDFRKLEVRELRLNTSQGDIIKLIRELSFSFADMAEKKNIGLHFTSTIPSLLMTFDEDKLERIVFNLLSNAFKFTPGNGRIDVSLQIVSQQTPAPQPTKPPTPQLQFPESPIPKLQNTALEGPPGPPAQQSPRWLQMNVRDTGIGIEKDKQEKIFERFFQNDIPGSLVNQGSGIGLAITREFVKLHHGLLSVESTPGQGSCFTVLLPVHFIDSIDSIPPPSLNPSTPSSSTYISSDPSTSPYSPIPYTSSIPSTLSSLSALSSTPPISPLSSPSSTPLITSSDPDSSHADPLFPYLSPPEQGAAPASAVTGRSRTKTDPRSKRPVVLLVEDNEDFRFYLKDNLREFFVILEAVNGKEGWQKTLGAHPDLVVSDISMPEMNGIDLCRKIKEDNRTSFIPVILLTALIGEEQQLKALGTGANDYMTKPFNFEILLSRIRNLLHQQETARKTWQKQMDPTPADIAITSADEKFIRQALELVEKNIANPDFSVEEMSRDLFISRVALYKKILALTGKTPIEFIRYTRLKRAAQLLEKSQLTVAEIAYEVGFNNPKYFSRYFKDAFGVLPSVYQKQPRS